MCPKRSKHNLIDFFIDKAATSEEAIEQMLAENDLMKWLLRILGVFLACVGFHLFLKPIQVIADIVFGAMCWFRRVPLLGWALDFLGNMACGATAIVLGFVALGVG